MRSRGFTLIEVMVSLAVALLITGGVMGLFSSGFKLLSKVETKTADIRVLDAAAQMILADPGMVHDKESVTISELPGDPVVKVSKEKVEKFETGELDMEEGGLYRIGLTYRKTTIYFSMIIVESDYKETTSSGESS